MITNEFITWLIDVRGLSETVAKNRASNCKKVWLALGNLDQHYRRDEGKYVLYLLTYTRADKRENAASKHGMEIKGDIFNNTATYKQAVKKYMEFREYQDSQKFSNI